MRLRIVSGSLRGRVIRLGAGDARFRPTQDRCRESVAEILKDVVGGALVADVCAGSGAFGFELLSRGAREAHFVEADKRRCESIARHAHLFGVEEQCRLFPLTVRTFLKNAGTSYDIVFYDPPYEDDDLAGKVPALLGILGEHGVLVYEHASERQPAELSGDAALGFGVDSRGYGDTVVDFYRRRIV